MKLAVAASVQLQLKQLVWIDCTDWLGLGCCAEMLMEGEQPSRILQQTGERLAVRSTPGMYSNWTSTASSHSLFQSTLM